MSKQAQPSPLVRYASTHQYHALMKKHSLAEQGIWRIRGERIRGEDPNCDFGGYHQMPELGVFEGKLADVIAHAVELPSFWTWGAGGSIEKVSITRVDDATTKKRQELRKEIAELEARLARANEQLKGL